MRTRQRFILFALLLVFATAAFTPSQAEPIETTGVTLAWSDIFDRIAERFESTRLSLNHWRSGTINAAAAQEAPTVDEPMEWKPSFNLPRPSEFTGSVSYGYSIPVPPGANGLQPAVGLSYSNAGSNNSVGSTQSNPEGWGWNLSGMIEITQDLKVCDNHPHKVCVNSYEDFYTTELAVTEDGESVTKTFKNYRPTFSLVINGTGYDLIHQDGRVRNGATGRYIPQGSNTLYVELCGADDIIANPSKCGKAAQLNGATNSSGYFWVVITPDNLMYRIGYTPDGEQSVKPGRYADDKPEYPAYEDEWFAISESYIDDQAIRLIPVLRWRVDTVEDRYGNQMKYSYDEPAESDNQLRVLTELNYLRSISYSSRGGAHPFSGTGFNTTLLFNYTFNQEDYDAGPTDNQPRSVLSFQTRELESIDIVVNGEIYRSHQMTYVHTSYGKERTGDGQPGGAIKMPTDPVYTDFKTVKQQNDCTADQTFQSPKLDGWHAKLLSTITEIYYVPDASMPDGVRPVSKYSDKPDVQFTYVFRQTGRDDDAQFNYCRPYLKSTKVIYNGPGNSKLPSMRINWSYVNNKDKEESRVREQWFYSGFESGQSDKSVSETPGQLITYQYKTPIRTVTKSQPHNDQDKPLVGYGQVTRQTTDLAKSNIFAEEVLEFHAIPLGRTEGTTNALEPISGRTKKSEAWTYSGGTRSILSRSETYWDVLGQANEPVVLATRSQNLAEGQQNLGAVTFNQYEPQFGLQVDSRTWVNNSSYLGGADFRTLRDQFNWGGPSTSHDQQTKTTYAYDDSGSKWYIGLPVRTRSWAKGTGSGSASQLIETADTILRYDNQGCTQPDGTVISQTFDKGQVTAVDTLNVDPDGKATTSGGCRGGKYVTSRFVFGGGSAQAWQIRRMIDPNKNRTTYAWQDGVRLKSTSSGGLTTSYIYGSNDHLWQVTDITTPLGTTRYDYDQWGRLIRTTAPTGTIVQEIDYREEDKIFNVVVATFPQNTALKVVTRTYYDGFGRPIGVQTNKAGLGETVYQATSYDVLGRAVCQSDIVFGNLAILGGTPSKLNRTCTAETHKTLTSYNDAKLEVTTTLPDGTTSQQNTNGLTSIQIDPLGRETHYVNDRFGRLARVIEQAHTGTPYTTRYGYNAGGFLTSVIDHAGNQTSMTYDTLGRKLDMSDPDMGNWSYVYDANGNLRGQNDNDNQTLCFSYDSLNRMTAKVHIGETPVSTLIKTKYDQCGPATEVRASYSYNGDGLLDTVSWPGVEGGSDQERFNYDTYGRLTAHIRTLNSIDYRMGYGKFDLADRPQEITYPDNEVVQFEYDVNGLDTLTAGNDELVAGIDHNFRGQIDLIQRGSGGLNTNYSYFAATVEDNASNESHPGNSLYRLSEIVHGATNDSVSDYHFDYDQVGNIIFLGEQIGEVMQTQSFEYDALNRLDIAKAVGGSFAPTYTRNYQYNPLGNITAINGKAYTYGSSRPHAVTEIKDGAQTYSFGYDANGNMTSRVDETGRYTQIFDVENRLTEVFDQSTGDLLKRFYYDHAGQRTITISTDQETGETSTTYYPFPEYEEIRREQRLINEPPILALNDRISTAGDSVRVQLEGTDPEGDQLIFEVAGLPAGLVWNPNGLITGTPTTVGTSIVSVEVDDQNGNRVAGQFSWEITQGDIPAPVVTLTSDKAVVTIGETFTLDWHGGPHADYCKTSWEPRAINLLDPQYNPTNDPNFDGWPVVVNGITTNIDSTGFGTGSLSYRIICWNAEGESGEATVNVQFVADSPAPAPVVNLWVNAAPTKAAEVTIGETFSLVWAAQDVATCYPINYTKETADGETIPLIGTTQINSTGFGEGTLAYQLTCESESGETVVSSATVTLDVEGSTTPVTPVPTPTAAPPGEVTVRFYTADNQYTVTIGDDIDFVWSSSNADECRAQWNSSGVPLSGTQSILTKNNQYGYQPQPGDRDSFYVECRRSGESWVRVTRTIDFIGAEEPQPSPTTAPLPQVTVQFRTADNRYTVPVGDDLNFVWSSSHADECRAQWNSSGVPLSGTQTILTQNNPYGYQPQPGDRDSFYVECRQVGEAWVRQSRTIVFVAGEEEPEPTLVPTLVPTLIPTLVPTLVPTLAPTVAPTVIPAPSAWIRAEKSGVQISSVEIGEQFVIRWGSSGVVDRCDASWSNGANIGPSGTRTISTSNTSPGNYKYWVRCWNAGGSSGQKATAVTFVSPPQTQFIGEIGSRARIPYNTWITINYANRGAYDQPPVVIAQTSIIPDGSAANRDKHPVAIVRLDDITTTSFKLKVQKEPGAVHDSALTTEITWMAMIEGEWEIETNNGVRTIQAGKLASNATVWNNPQCGVDNPGWQGEFTQVRFNDTFDNSPIVLSQVQTFNEATYLLTRQSQTDEDGRNTISDRSGFYLAMQEHDGAPNPTHATESIGWIAMEKGGGKWNNSEYFVGEQYFPEQIDGQNWWRGMGSQLAGSLPIRLFSSVSTANGTNSVHTRAWESANGTYYLKLEEDTTKNCPSDPTHRHKNGETVDYFRMYGGQNLDAYPAGSLEADLSSRMLTAAGINPAGPLPYDKGGEGLSLATGDLFIGPAPMPIGYQMGQAAPDVSMTIRKTYLAGGTPIAQRTVEKEGATVLKDELHFIYTDHLGSGNTLTDATGNVVHSARFYPFGDLRGENETLGSLTERGFTGHRENRDIGLTYMNARYYVPGIGRFASADTIVPDPIDPQSFDRYAYVVNNPIASTDPTGHECLDAIHPGDVETCNHYEQLIHTLPGGDHFLEGWKRGYTMQDVKNWWYEYSALYNADSYELEVDAVGVNLSTSAGTGVMATVGLELVFNLHSKNTTLFVVPGAGAMIGGDLSGTLNGVVIFNIGEDNLSYAGTNLYVEGGAALGSGPNGGIAWVPGDTIACELGCSVYGGVSTGVSVNVTGGMVEYIPFATYDSKTRQIHYHDNFNDQILEAGLLKELNQLMNKSGPYAEMWDALEISKTEVNQ